MATRLTLLLNPLTRHLFGSSSHCFLVVANNWNSLKAADHVTVYRASRATLRA